MNNNNNNNRGVETDKISRNLQPRHPSIVYSKQTHIFFFLVRFGCDHADSKNFGTYYFRRKSRRIILVVVFPFLFLD
jgi:hypothetical protein